MIGRATSPPTAAPAGPVALSLQLPNFFIGINDPLGQNPHGTPFTSQIFDLYRPWLGLHGHEDTAKRQSIARGEEVFNNTNINITGVSGLNDDLGVASIPGFCGTCHDTPNVGNHSVKAPLDIGIPDAGANKPPVLDISGLPVFTLTCTQGPLTGHVYKVTDAGKAMISGQCKDIGRFKGPILRGLASRAPYFHNGSAATLQDVVNFYDQRFAIGFTDQQKTDLVNFLNSPVTHSNVFRRRCGASAQCARPARRPLPSSWNIVFAISRSITTSIGRPPARRRPWRRPRRRLRSSR